MPILRPVSSTTRRGATDAAAPGWAHPQSDGRADADIPAGAEIGPLGEFIDALKALQRGHVLVQVSDGSGGWLLNGAVLYTAHRALVRYGLAARYDNPCGFSGVRYFRITAAGSAVAREALARWAKLPLYQRLWLRVVA